MNRTRATAGLIERGLSLFARKGLRKGLVGGSNAWVAVGAAAFVLRWIRRTNAPKTVYVSEIRSGERLVITSIDPSSPVR